MSKYLDSSGVTYLWSKIKSKFALKTDVNTVSDNIQKVIPYGVCSTEAATVAKEVTVPKFELKDGALVVVKFTNANSIASPTLNVNGTGAKPIYRYGTTAVSTSQSTTGWRAGAVQLFVYDGAGWVRDFWENTAYTNVGLGYSRSNICKSRYTFKLYFN